MRETHRKSEREILRVSEKHKKSERDRKSERETERVRERQKE